MPGSAVSDLAGRVLAGRYLLHGAIGTGASGRVYAAEDTRLRRRVAVKVLHAALAEDAAFLRRFRAEAQLAASLHHPHIVTVHDWGEDDVPFMVLELLEGGSLRSLLDQGELLTVPQAARVGRDVTSALEYAHARGVMHRDIKPANLLFDEHGIVRVADFGLARALAEASWTEPAGAVFGTARYASPEQALGVQLDGRSDCYSLALVLVEAVTGRIPFAADTTLGTLTARTQRPLIAPEELGPLAHVIDRAGAIDPDARYPDAGTMRHAIADAADTLPPPGPLVLAGMIDRADPHPTRAVPDPTAPLFDQDHAEIAPVWATPTPDGDDIVIEAERETERERRRRTGERRLVPMVVAIVLLITIAAAAAALAQVRTAKPIHIPGFVGLTSFAAAQAQANKNGVNVSVGQQRSAPDPAGTVIDQSPSSGAFTTNHHVTLVLSTGPAKVAVPSIVKTPWSSAKQALDAAGLTYDTKPATHYDNVVPFGDVLTASPTPGTLILPDQPVHIVLSAGHAPVAVPDVKGQKYDDAVKTLTAAHFKVKRASKDDFDDTIPAGDVIGTDPPIGKNAPYGGTITVHVSKGPDLVTVPDLSGMTLDEASQALDAQGLSLELSGKYKSGQHVRGQTPGAGTQLVRGSSVQVTFSKSDCILGFICLGG